MAAEESDCECSRPVLDGRYQSVIVALDVEHDPAALENARFRIRRLDILRIAPIGAGHNVEPSFIFLPAIKPIA